MIRHLHTMGKPGGRGRGRFGFTLLELLVVVTIIVLLLTLMIPGIQSALYRARQIKCMANLNQMGKALMMYVTEHDNFPGQHWKGEQMVWAPRIRAYLNYDQTIFYCPENMYWGLYQDLSSQGAYDPDEDVNRARARWAQWKKTFKSTRPNSDDEMAGIGYLEGETIVGSWTVFSYGYNDWGTQESFQPHLGLGGWAWDPKQMPKSYRSVASPSSLFAIADSRTDGHWDCALDPTPGSGSGNDESPSMRHFLGANMLCADGHCELIKHRDMCPNQYISLRSNVELCRDKVRRWNNDNMPHDNTWGTAFRP